MTTKTQYYMRKVVWVTLGDNGVKNVNIGWGDADFILNKGANGVLEFVIRDIDRKPVKLLGVSINCSIINNSNEELVLEKELLITDYINGRGKIIITPSDMQNWEIGFYRYVLTFNNLDNEDFVYLYNDFNQEVVGYIELRDKAIGKPPKAQEQTSFTPVKPNIGDETRYYSGVFKGPAQLGYTSNLMTVAFYGSNFTGNVYAEISLDPIADQNIQNWVPIQLVPGQDFVSFNDLNAVEPYNIYGDYHYLRFSFTKESGDITKILVN